ncbi:hypothetical protein T08_9561 [Trichinella sp. T8]|nr:hypothetical protein T08_9561 [Trichinella sp. T8]
MAQRGVKLDDCVYGLNILSRLLLLRARQPPVAERRRSVFVLLVAKQPNRTNSTHKHASIRI